MNSTPWMVLCVFTQLILTTTILEAQRSMKNPKLFDWENDFDVVYRSVNNPNGKELPLIKIKGNKFVNEKGDTILFRGVAIADPDKIEQEGKWNKNLFVKVKEFGATIVRLPVHPAAWRTRTPSKYLPLLDQAVDWCTELGMYVIIDWHSIGNLGMELFQNPEYNTTKQETYEFWRIIAIHFKGNNTVAFYELFNEPTLDNGQLGSMTWSEWKKIVENIIHLVRAYDKEKIPLVAGLDWAYDLTPLHIEPIDAEGIGYVSHPYPNKRKRPFEPKWEEDFGFAADKYPIVVTEFGFAAGMYGITKNDEYGKEIIQYLENKGISWVCWIFDPEWTPNLIESWDSFKLTESGEFFKQSLRKTAKK